MKNQNLLFSAILAMELTGCDSSSNKSGYRGESPQNLKPVYALPYEGKMASTPASNLACRETADYLKLCTVDVKAYQDNEAKLTEMIVRQNDEIRKVHGFLESNDSDKQKKIALIMLLSAICALSVYTQHMLAKQNRTAARGIEGQKAVLAEVNTEYNRLLMDYNYEKEATEKRKQSGKTQFDENQIKTVCKEAIDCLKILVNQFDENERGYLLPLLAQAESVEKNLKSGNVQSAWETALKIKGAIKFIEDSNAGQQAEPAEEASVDNWASYLKRNPIQSEWLDDQSKLLNFFMYLELPPQLTWSSTLNTKANLAFRKAISTHGLHPDQTRNLSESEKAIRTKIFIILKTGIAVFADEALFAKYIKAYKVSNKI